MPIYKDNAENRRLKRVGMSWGKACQPCKTNKKKVLVGTSKKGEKKFKVPADKEKLKKLQKEVKKLKSMIK